MLGRNTLTHPAPLAVQSSLYCMAQLVLAYMWGVVSDRYGRKQLILMSNLFSTVSMLMFGLAGNYTVAAAARIIGGACVSSSYLRFLPGLGYDLSCHWVTAPNPFSCSALFIIDVQMAVTRWIG